MTISKQDVIAAQESWGAGIVAIAEAHKTGGDFKKRAEQHINDLYAYELGDVLFKPTLAAENQFRPTFEGALSYFIGTAGTEDSGFATNGWTHVRWENNGIFIGSDTAMAMGNYHFTAPDGSETKVEYSFGYIPDNDGKLRINLHHSSLPYSPE